MFMLWVSDRPGYVRRRGSWGNPGIAGKQFDSVQEWDPSGDWIPLLLGFDLAAGSPTHITLATNRALFSQLSS